MKGCGRPSAELSGLREGSAAGAAGRAAVRESTTGTVKYTTIYERPDCGVTLAFTNLPFAVGAVARATVWNSYATPLISRVAAATDAERKTTRVTLTEARLEFREQLSMELWVEVPVEKETAARALLSQKVPKVLRESWYR